MASTVTEGASVAMACEEALPAERPMAHEEANAEECSCSGAYENPAAARPLLSVAPMMDWTDVHFRQLARLLSRRTWLWTEMVVDKTILHTQNLDKFLWFPAEQRPLVLQLGGSDPATLAAAAAKAAAYGYDEINLNCGCPSDRVAGAGCFGAALMMQPALVAECMAAMAAATSAAGPAGGRLPLSVKCRLGVDEADSYGALHEFVRVVSEGSPVTHFIVHARKAYLNGLSPHQNRTVPPLRHQWAWALARDFPHLQFSLNGGLLSAHDARAALLTAHPAVPYSRAADLPRWEPAAAAAAVCSAPTGASSSSPSASSSSGGAAAAGAAAGAVSDNRGGVEGVMIGRGAYNDPWGCLADADRAVFGEAANAAPSRRAVIAAYREYAEPMVGRWHVKPDGHADPSVRTLMRPLLNLFHGEPGCKRWKAAVDEILKAGPTSFGEVLDRSLHLIPDHVLDAPPRCPDLGSLGPFPLDPELPGPASRAGHHQGPPGTKPPRGQGGGKASGAAAAAAAPPVAVTAEAGGARPAVEGGGSVCGGEVGGREAAAGDGGAAVGCCAEAREAAAEAEAAAAAAAGEGAEQRGDGGGARAEGRGRSDEGAGVGPGEGEGEGPVGLVAREGAGVCAPCGGEAEGVVLSCGGADNAAAAGAGRRTAVVAAAADGGRGGAGEGEGAGRRRRPGRQRGCVVC